MEEITNKDINIAIDPKAVDQLILMKKHDYTLEDKVFRIKIGGKGCDGFTYELGFSLADDEDLVISLAPDLNLHMDPFSAYFCRKGSINYHFDPTGDEGLTFENDLQEEFHGKFFKDESTVPKFLKKYEN